MKCTLFLACILSMAGAHSILAQSNQPAIFITNNVGDSISSFTINTDGTLSFVNTFVTGDGPQSISLSPNGRFLAIGHGTASSTTEELRIFEVHADATLTPRLTTLVPDSPLDMLWLNDSLLAVPETDLSASTIRTYRFDDMANSLTQLDVFASGGFASSLTRSNDGQYLFTNNTNAGTIISLSVDAVGEMSLVDTAFLPGFAVDISLSRDGRFLYGAGGISDNGDKIYAHSVDSNGMLDAISGSPFVSFGASPKVTAVTGDDQILVAGHGTDATFWSFLRDPLTGALTPTNFFFDVGLQGTLGDLAILDDLLFVTDESTAIDGITGVYSFRINSDGSFTQLGPILNTQGARPEYIATWPGLIVVCDFDLDGDCDIDDLNQLLAEGPIAPGVPTSAMNQQFDLDGNGTIDLDDLDQWLASAASENELGSPYKRGDGDLNGVVDGLDFLIWNEFKFSGTLQWDQGDFNGDGQVDGLDFLLWNENKFTSSDSAETVPEPVLLSGWLWLALLTLTVRSARPRRN